MKFNGWQRLWVFACVLMAACTVIVAAVDFPKEAAIEDSFQSRIGDLTPERIEHYRKLLSVNKYAALYDTPTPPTSEAEVISQGKLKASQ